MYRALFRGGARAELGAGLVFVPFFVTSLSVMNYPEANVEMKVLSLSLIID